MDNSKNFICMTNQNSTFSHVRENSRMFIITSKYFSFFNNEPLASWVAHITRDFLTCYSCLYYSSMVAWPEALIFNRHNRNIALLWLILKWYTILKDFFLLDSVRYLDDVMMTSKVWLVQYWNPDVRLLSEIDIAMCFIYNISATSWRYWGRCHSDIVTISECPLGYFHSQSFDMKCLLLSWNPCGYRQTREI